MTAVADAAGRLAEALKAVKGLRMFKLGAAVDRAGVIVGMPRLSYESYSPGTVTGATFPVFLIVPLDERAPERLWEFAEPVAEALESVYGATVGTADPGLYLSGGNELPSYTFTVEMSL